MRRTMWIAVVSVALSGCAAGASTNAPAVSLPGPTASTAASSAAVGASPGEPSGVIAIGHSGLTGEGTGGVSEPALENSWATGSNPDVNSVYLRLKGAHPELAGVAINQARGGANADELPGMAERALSSVPAPALAIIQTIDNDIRCDGTDDAHVPELGASVGKAIETITGASPDAKVLVVGQLGRPSIPFIKTLVAHDPSVVGPLEEGGRCAFLDADGKPIPANFDVPNLDHRRLRRGAGPRVRRVPAVPDGRRRAGRLRRHARELLPRLDPPQREGPGGRGGA